MAKIVKNTTQKGKQILSSYYHGAMVGKTQLAEVYGHCSKAKASALTDCVQIKEELGGRDGYICNHTTHFFTYGFLKVDPETGEVKTWLRYETRDNSYEVEVPA